MPRDLTIKPLTPLRFRVYCYRRRRTKRSKWYRVLIFRDRHEMRQFIVEVCRRKIVQAGVTVRFYSKRQRSPSFWRGTMGWCTHFGDKLQCEDPRQVGLICFCREATGGNVVAHEMTHAAHFHLGRGPQKRLDSRDIEPLASLVGELVGQFWRYYWSELDRRRRRRGSVA